MSVLEEFNGTITEYEYQKRQERKQERKRKRKTSRIKGEMNMNELEAMEILEEVKELDDSMYQFNPKYMEALETVLTLTRNLHNFMRGLWEEHCVGDITYTSKEIYDDISREVFGEDKGSEE